MSDFMIACSWQMPNRLSVDGKNLHDLEVENMRVQASPQMTAAGMAVPDKITLTGIMSHCYV